MAEGAGFFHEFFKGHLFYEVQAPARPYAGKLAGAEEIPSHDFLEKTALLYHYILGKLGEGPVILVAGEGRAALGCKTDVKRALHDGKRIH